MKRGGVKKEQQVSALQQIQALFDAAALAFSKSPEKARALVQKAHRLVLRFKVKLPVVLKKRFCKHCHTLWIPGRTVRVRLTKGRIVYSCLRCKRIKRQPIGRYSGRQK